jgi:hypothetical protein
MTHSTRIVALSLIVAAAAPARAQLSVTADSTTSTQTIAPATVPTVFPAGAADASAATSVSSTDVATLGAPLTGLRAGVHARETARTLQPAAAPAHANLGQARAMMVVGVAGLIAGAIIGGSPGTIVMVGGAVVGLFGLYDYLQ